MSAILSLDKEAAAQVDDLAEQLRVADLRAAGWRIEGPAPAPGGRTELRAVKGFDSPAGARRAIQELSGPSGPFGSLRLTRSRSFFRTRTALNGTVDLTAGLEVFSDETLRARLGGTPLGVDPSLLRTPGGGGTADGGFAFSVRARLPGTVEANSPDLLWRVRPGQRVAVSASAEQWNVPNIVLGTLSLIFGAALVVTLARWRRPG